MFRPIEKTAVCATPTICLIGASVTGENRPIRDGINYYYQDRGYFTWANALLGQRFDVLNVGFQGGGDVADVAALLHDEVLAYKPRYCLVCAGTADISQGNGLFAVTSGLTNLVNSLLREEIIPILLTALPNSMINTVTERNLFYQINNWIISNSAKLNYLAIDACSGYIDYTNAYPIALANHTYDGIHVNNRGAFRMGQKIHDVLVNIVPERPCIIQADSDPYIISANPCLAGTGGQKFANVTGDIADDWKGYVQNGAVVGSKLTRNAMPGVWQRLAVTASANNCKASFYNISTDLGAHAGEQVYAFAEVRLDPNISVGQKIVFSVKEENSTPTELATNWSLFWDSVNSENFEEMNEAGTIMLKTPIFTLHADMVRLTPIVEFGLVTNGDTGIIDIGRIGVKLV